MVTVSVVWNVYLWSTGRRVTMRHVRQAFVPGVFFGLNLAIFFAGATHNSVANAALIGSLSPFLIVPIGARLFREYINPRALVFALVAFGGVGIVLFSAPPEWGRVATGQRVRRAGDAALDGLRACRRGTFAGTWTSPPSCRRSVRSRRWPCFRWRSPTGTCSA